MDDAHGNAGGDSDFVWWVDVVSMILLRLGSRQERLDYIDKSPLLLLYWDEFIQMDLFRQ